jgi:hypothetical protein
VRSLYSRLLPSAAFIAALVAVPAFGLNPSDGPRDAVAAIRHDLPILLADALTSYEVRPTPVIEWVLTDGREGVAEWRAGQRRGVVVLRFRTGRWWWLGAASNDSTDDGTWSRMRVPGTDLDLCEGSRRGPPSAHDLLVQGFIDAPLAARVSQTLGTTPQSGAIAIALCDSFGEYGEGSTTGGYVASFFHPKNDLPVPLTLDGRGPADWQRPSRPGSELYYVFRLSAEKPAAARFTAGSTFGVWFPFVLDTKKLYKLRISDVTPELQVAPKSTKNNVLHFVLPAFEIPEGSMALGEINAESP